MANTIVVNRSPIPDMVFSFGRDAAKIIIAFCIGRGWITGDVATLLAGLGGALAVAYGQFSTYTRASQLATLAGAPVVPDIMAQIKGGDPTPAPTMALAPAPAIDPVIVNVTPPPPAPVVDPVPAAVLNPVDQATTTGENPNA